MRRTFKALIASLVLQLVAIQALANSFTDFPGAVPRTATRTAATDLFIGGRVVTPDEADRLRAGGKDLSLVNPAVSDLWSPDSRVPQKQPALNLNVSGETFRYLSDMSSRIGYFRFAVTRPDANGNPRTYTITVAKTAHNILLRKALLRKLGYQTPDVKRLRTFKVEFSDSFTRKAFVENVQKNTFGDAERWIKDPKNEDSTVAVMQDAIVVASDSPIYDLTTGAMTSEIVRGRRILNSLLVPYNLTDVPESINLFTWHAGRITNDMIYLPYEEASEFFPSLDDARWIVRRIANLTREDFKQIAAEADYPAEETALAAEKLVSRRNSLVGYFGVQAAPLPVDGSITMGTRLVGGKLVHMERPGYGSKFSYGDPLAPLSSSEIRAFFKSRAFSTAIDNVVNQFNLNVIPRTDVNKKIAERQVRLAQERFIDFLKTGREQKTPFGLWATPTINGNLIVSRDVVTGSYMGTDNLVQLADSFGFSVEGGVFVGVDGLPVRVSAGAQAKLAFVRTYTHIKPIKSIKAAMKEPYRNVVVPLLKKDIAKIFDKIASRQRQLSEDPEKQKALDLELQAALDASMAEFKKQLAPGESILISDSLNKIMGLSLGYGLDKNIALHGSLSGSDVAIRRLHIFRKDDDTIQVYRAPADYDLVSASAGFDAFIPIFNVRFTRKAGQAETFFYELNIKADHEKNPDLNSNFRALQQLLVSNSTESVEVLQKPFKITHRFQEKSKDGRFFMWRWLDAETNDRISAVHPGGGKKDFLYWSEAEISGKSYEALAVDVIAAALEELAKSENLVVAAPGSGMPGSGIFGRSVSRRATYEAELNLAPQRNPVTESFVEVNYEWKGWEISKGDLMKIIQEISEKFSFRFYPTSALQSTKKVQLYNVELKMSVYSAGIEALASSSKDKLAEALIRENKYQYIPDYFICGGGYCDDAKRKEQQQAKSEKLIRQFEKAQKRYHDARNRGDANEMAKQGLKMVSAAESALSAKGFIEMIGGEKNIFVQSALSGFRVGDEGGDTALISDTIGQIGSRKRNGPLRFVQENLGMTESEFFIFWLLNRI